MTQIEFLKTYTATFVPRHTDTLKPEVLPLIGQPVTVQALWEVEEGHTYAGEWAMSILAPAGQAYYWIPSGDLVLPSPPHC